jgi:hypothetical protein
MSTMALGRTSIVFPFLALAVAGCGSDGSTAAPAATDIAPAVAEQTVPGTDVAPTAPAGTPSSEPGAAPPVPSDVTVPADTSVPGPPSTLDGERAEADATEEDPVPVGEVIEITDLWDLRVTGVDLDATDEVRAFADINPAPEPGMQYVMISIEGVYLGDLVAQPVFEWSVSDGATEFRPSIPGCGVIPASIYDVVEVVPGETFAANLCVPVTTAATTTGLQLSLQPNGGKVWVFDLE